MFTVIAMGKWNLRMLSKTFKSPQSRGHSSFCLLNIDCVKSKSWVSFSLSLNEEKFPLLPVVFSKELFSLFIPNVYSNWVAAKFFNLNLRLSCKTEITTERSSLEIKVCKETSDFFFCIVACLTSTSTDKFGKWTDRWSARGRQIIFSFVFFL